MRRFLTPTLVVILAASCATDTAETATDVPAASPLVPTTRDSAGVAIHEHPADALERAPQIVIDSVPLATIGGAAFEELDLSDAHQPLMLSGNRVAVFAHHAVFIFGPDGAEIERIGREGAGPQEFGSGRLSRGLGDTIVVEDATNGRIAMVVPGAGVVRTRMFNARVGSVHLSPAAQVGDDDFLLTMGAYGLSSSREPGRLAFPVARLDPGADSARVILETDGPLFVPSESIESGMRSTTRIYEGVGLSAAWQGGVLTTEPERWVVSRHDAEGRVLARIVVPRARDPLTPEMQEADRARRVASFRSSNRPGPGFERTLEIVRSRPFADSLPHYTLVDTRNGSLAWLRAGALGGDSTYTYTAVRPDGIIMGQLRGRLPTPVALSDDRVILRDEDENGIVSWRVHRLVFPGSGADQ